MPPAINNRMSSLINNLGKYEEITKQIMNPIIIEIKPLVADPISEFRLVELDSNFLPL